MELEAMLISSEHCRAMQSVAQWPMDMGGVSPITRDSTGRQH